MISILQVFPVKGHLSFLNSKRSHIETTAGLLFFCFVFPWAYMWPSLKLYKSWSLESRSVVLCWRELSGRNHSREWVTRIPFRWRRSWWRTAVTVYPVNTQSWVTQNVFQTNNLFFILCLMYRTSNSVVRVKRTPYCPTETQRVAASITWEPWYQTTLII